MRKKKKTNPKLFMSENCWKLYRKKSRSIIYEHCQMHTFLSTDPETNIGYFWLIAKDVTKCSCASLIVRRHRCSLISSTRMLLSSLQDKIYLPEGWNNTQRTQFSWEVKVMRHIPFIASQSFTVRSREPDARYE